MHTVLFVNPTGERSGAENSLLVLIEALDRQKFRPIVACPCPGAFSDRCRELGVQVFPISFHNPVRSTPYSIFVLRPRQTSRLISRLESIVKAEKVDLLHPNSYLVGVACGAVSRRLGVPVIWHVRDMRSGLKLQLIRYLADRFADRILVVSQAVKDNLGSRLDKKVRVVYNGVRTKAFMDDERRRCREELGVGPDEFLVGNVGVLMPWKGQDLFIKIARRVLDDIPAAKFVVVGPSWDQSLGFDQQLKALADDLGMKDRIIFTGYRKDAPTIEASMDVYVHTSREPDPLPRVVLEAMSAGVPVVAPSNGGIPEMIADGDSGLLYPTGDIETAAMHVAHLLESPQVAKQMGDNARERARSVFSVESHVNSVQEIYAEILNSITQNTA